MNTSLSIHEILPQVFTRSMVVILEFDQIPDDLPDDQNMRQFYDTCHAQGSNPRLAENRQRFNNQVLQKTNKRYLIGRYGEDRKAMLTGTKIAKEGRTYHLGIDIFCKDLEPVFAPCDGEIVAAGKDEGAYTFGYYVIFKPDPKVMPQHMLFAHLSKDVPPLGQVKGGKQFATLGDFINDENGSWSRHLHVQLLAEPPADNQLPPGYSSKEDLAKNTSKYPDPSLMVFKQ